MKVEQWMLNEAGALKEPPKLREWWVVLKDGGEYIYSDYTVARNTGYPLVHVREVLYED